MKFLSSPEERRYKTYTGFVIKLAREMGIPVATAYLIVLFWP